VVDPISSADLAAVEALLDAEFAGRVQVRLGEVVDVLALPGLVARADGRVTGYVAYRVDDGEAEIAALVVAAGERHAGTGTALVEAVARLARDAGARRLWLVTTNDNVDALRFYQRRGFRLAELHVGAVDEARRLEPAIPAVGDHGIPIRDELVLERPLR
jgi:ribosomal protein S18 acetylase RimI-like enzyme